MKIIVLAGSPKGLVSVTLQYVLFIQKRFAEHDFQIIDICEEHEKIEHDEAAFRKIMDDVRGADGVLWAYPVTTFLVHAYYKRFIELIFAREEQDAFRGKYAAVLTTSIHFFDHTSHNYMHAICDDLGMNYVGSYSARVYDMLEEEEKRRLMLFVRSLLNAIDEQMPTVRAFDPVQGHTFDYVPSQASGKLDLGDKRLVILTDGDRAGTNLDRMVDRLNGRFAGATEVVNLHDIAIRYGCDGCFQCGADGVCVYRDADDIHDLYMSKLTTADIVVMAGTIEDRYLSHRWKLFFDRGFFRPLIPWFPGKQLAFVVSGPLKQLPNLRQILEGYTEFHQGNLVDIVTDESEDSESIDKMLDSLSRRLDFCAREGYVRPQTFLGIGGTRIFRDDTYGMLRPVFQVAHRYYRKHGIYDFPQKSFGTMFLAIGGMVMTNIPGVRKKFFQTIKSELVKCLQKEVEKADAKGPR
jgi:multimeric flavodoxin WrbA